MIETKRAVRGRIDFAVVADEVKELAKFAHSSTERKFLMEFLEWTNKLKIGEQLEQVSVELN